MVQESPEKKHQQQKKKRTPKPPGYWQGEEGRRRGIELTKDLIENRLGWATDEEIYGITVKLFRDYGYGSMLDRVFKDSPSAAVMAAYPRRFEAWKFKATPQGTWKGEQGRKLGIKLTQRLIEEWLKWTADEQIYSISKKHFEEFGLNAMIQRVFKSSPPAAVMAAYPGRFETWKFKRAPRGIWKGEKGTKLGIELTRRLIEDWLGWASDEEIYSISQKHFKKYGLYPMIKRVFKSSPSAAVMTTYPGRFEAWKFKSAPKGTWEGEKGKKLGIELTRTLIEEWLSWTTNEQIYSITTNHFTEFGLDSILVNVFNHSPSSAVMAAYPGRFEAWKFKMAPLNTWKGEEGKQLGIELTRRLIEEWLGWTTDEQIYEITTKHFSDYGYGSVLSKVFHDSPSAAVMAAYPGRFEAWRFKKAPLGTWTGEKGRKLGIELTRRLIEEWLGWTTDEVIYSISQKHFKEFGLNGMIQRVYKGSPSAAVMAAYPGRFEAWKFKMAPLNTWKGKEGKELGIELTRRLIEEWLGWKTDEQIYSITQKHFVDHGLNSMLAIVFKGSPSTAVMAAYPERFEARRFKHTPPGTWKGEKGKQLGIELTRRLIEEQLRWTRDEQIYSITANHFREYGYDGMLNEVFHHSPATAVMAVYPGRFEAWKFKHGPQGIWKGKKGKRLGIKLTRRLIEEWLQWTTDEQIYSVSQKHFKKHGIMKMLEKVFFKSPSAAVMAAYPNRFEAWKFKNVPMGTWKGEKGRKLGIELTRRLIEEQLKWTTDEQIYSIAANHFREYGLIGMLDRVFNWSPSEAVMAAYPNRFTKEHFFEEYDRRFKYATLVGRETEKVFVKYVEDYCLEHGYSTFRQKKTGKGRVDLWCEMDKTIVIDITRASTKGGVTQKWRKRDYHTDPRVDEVWIIVNSDAFDDKDYIDFTVDAPYKVRVFHISEVFDMFGEPPREIKLELEKYAVSRFYNPEKAEKLYQEALAAGRDHIIEEKERQALLEKWMEVQM